MDLRPFAVTISHQLGSGGALLGQALAERLNALYIDREILRKAADELHLAEAELENREEHLRTFWESFTQISEWINPAKGLALSTYIPTDKELFEKESQLILHIAEQNNAVFMGRCGNYILREHPRHLNVLVCADLPARIERLRELYHFSAEEARKKIEANDRERSAYIRSFTHQDWFDARLYDLSINTTTIGMEVSVELILAGMEGKIYE